MEKKQKIAGYLIAALLAFAPLAVYGQWTLPAGSGLPGGTVYGIISAIMRWILIIFGFVGVIGFAISGILYLTAAGDEGQIEKAKKAMSYSIIGVIVGISGYVILQAATSMLTGFSVTF
ncbi:MAG: hypothetical protein AAB487_03045 [Patescibacteria group bacterium]